MRTLRFDRRVGGGLGISTECSWSEHPQYAVRICPYCKQPTYLDPTLNSPLQLAVIRSSTFRPILKPCINKLAIVRLQTLTRPLFWGVERF